MQVNINAARSSTERTRKRAKKSFSGLWSNLGIERCLISSVIDKFNQNHNKIPLMPLNSYNQIGRK